MQTSVAALLEEAAQRHRRGALAEAASRYRQVLASEPEQPQALYALAVICCQHGQFAEGIELARRSLAGDPRQPRAHNLVGMALSRLGRHSEALAGFEDAIAQQPDFADAHGNRAGALMELGRNEEAVASFERTVALRPESVGDWLNMGTALHALGRHADAIASYDRVIALAPNLAEAHFNRANVLAQIGRDDEALAAYARALALGLRSPDGLNNCGNVLVRLGRHDEALAKFDQALALAPGHADALTNRGIALRHLACDDEALASYQRALAVAPDHVGALYNRSVALMRLGRYPEAIACLERVRSIDPLHAHALSLLAECGLTVCDWRTSLTEDLRAGIDAGRAVMPFITLKLPFDSAYQLICARNHARRTLSRIAAPLSAHPRARQGKIRLAYLSADFHAHATAHLIARLIERHDRARFEAIGVSFGPDDASQERLRLQAAFDRYLDVRGVGDRDVAERLRALGVHIAVDLKGYTEDARPSILAHRPAPIQVSYLGYPGTLGVDFIDYIIADEITLPSDQQRSYTESIVHLPDSYQVNDPTRQVSQRVIARREASLPDDAFVFCCFNNSWKITAAVFAVWVRLLKNVEHSVLWLLRANDLAVRNLRAEAGSRGVNPDRLIFAPRRPVAEHLARHRLADLFLDTLPYNAHTTGSDALWSGLPVLTCRGETFAGRVGASLLHAAGLPELVTTNLPDYEAAALRLASDPGGLRAIRMKLGANRSSCPLFDIDRFRRHIEAAYAVMWQRWESGHGPAGFRVDSIEPDGAATS